MTITTPLALLLLLAVPLILYIGWPRNRFRRRRDTLSLLLRLTIVLLLVFALAGTQIVQSADRLAVVFLLDVSDSMGVDNQEAALVYIQEAMNDMAPDDLAAVVAFGSEAQVARSMSTARELGPIRAQPSSGNTNLAAAVRLGLALFPEGTARRMVVLSDGQPTIGNTDGAAQLAAAADVEISYVMFERPQEPEVQVQDVSVPTSVDEDQEFDMTVTVASEEATDAVVTIFASGQIVTRADVSLREGQNTFTWRLRSGSTGFRDWMVRVEPAGSDGFYQNNQLGAFSRVEGASRVLVVSNPDQDETRYLVPALEETGIEVDVIPPGALPISVTGLAQYESVVLANVPATDLSNQRMQVIERYVSDLGGGLVVIGGPNAYAPGGYFQTPLEDALPVEMRIRDQERLPQLTIAYLIDRSGSMGATGSSGIANIDLAKEAIIRSINFLQSTDRAGVASFDTNSYWIAEFQDVQNRRELQRLVATLRPSGGTSIMAGMQLVAADIVREESDLKHIILLTDGGAEPTGLVELSRQLYEENNVTTSVISIGQFEAEFLERMAEAANGNYHNVIDPATIPTIFTLETVLATRTYIQEEEFNPVLTAVHPIMDGISALPSLQGYVAATPRTAAQVILRGPEPFSDPLLVAWQYGLGRSVAYTSDATARWAQNWIASDSFARFWSQAVRWTITEGASRNLETRIVMEGEQARIIVDARDDTGGFLNGLDLQTSVINPTLGTERLQLRQVAPGQYEATFTPDEEGAYLFNVLGAGTTDDLNLSQITGWVMSYSPEYNVREVDDTLLANIADLTDGDDLSETPQAVFEHNLITRSTTVPIWPWLLLLALVLLPFDVAVRRLLVTASDLRRLNVWFQNTVLRRNIQTAAQAAAAERVSTLREARDRARVRTGTTTSEQPSAQPAATIGALRNRRAESREQRVEQQAAAPAQPAESPKPRFTRAAPTTEAPTPETEPGNIGSRLLKRRRGQEEDGESSS